MNFVVRTLSDALQFPWPQVSFKHFTMLEQGDAKLAPQKPKIPWRKWKVKPIPHEELQGKEPLRPPRRWARCDPDGRTSRWFAAAGVSLRIPPQPPCWARPVVDAVISGRVSAWREKWLHVATLTARRSLMSSCSLGSLACSFPKRLGKQHGSSWRRIAKRTQQYSPGKSLLVGQVIDLFKQLFLVHRERLEWNDRGRSLHVSNGSVSVGARSFDRKQNE